MRRSTTPPRLLPFVFLPWLACTAGLEGAPGDGPGAPAPARPTDGSGGRGGATGAGASAGSGSGGAGGVTGAGSGGTTGAGGATGAGEACGGTAVAAGKWRRLTTLQYRNSVRDLLGIEPDTTQFLQDTKTGPFSTNAGLPPQEVDVERYREAAEAVAAKVTVDLAKLMKCDPRTTGEDACAARFIADLGARAYRRPLSAEETAALTKVYQLGKQESFAAGVRLVVEGILQSPSFLYLVELGGAAQNGVAKLSGHEVASRLSYLLWNTTPDAELMIAAKEGRLDDAAGLRKQAERLVASARFQDTVAAFHTQLFSVAKLEVEGIVSKGTGFPEFDAAMRKAMVEDARRFAEYVFTKGNGTVEQLLTAPFAFPSGPLTKLYGGPAPGADGKVDLPNRSGILTLAGVLAAEPALATPYSATYRGKLVRTNLLCQEIPPPTVKVEFNAPPGAEKMSQQELLRAHQENDTCSPCHKLMDSIGFGLETYDAIGRHRTTDGNGRPIDASGIVEGAADGRFDGPKALAAKLAKMPEVRSCLAKQWFRYTLGRDAASGDACSVRAVEAALAAGAGDIRQAILALVASDAFRFRRVN